MLLATCAFDAVAPLPFIFIVTSSEHRGQKAIDKDRNRPEQFAYIEFLNRNPTSRAKARVFCQHSLRRPDLTVIILVSVCGTRNTTMGTTMNPTKCVVTMAADEVVLGGARMKEFLASTAKNKSIVVLKLVFADVAFPHGIFF